MPTKIDLTLATLLLAALGGNIFLLNERAELQPVAIVEEAPAGAVELDPTTTASAPIVAKIGTCKPQFELTCTMGGASNHQDKLHCTDTPLGGICGFLVTGPEGAAFVAAAAAGLSRESETLHVQYTGGKLLVRDGE